MTTRDTRCVARESAAQVMRHQMAEFGCATGTSV